MKRLLAVVATLGLVALAQPAAAALSGTGLSATASATESGSSVTVSYTATDASSRLITGSGPGINDLEVGFDVLNCSQTYAAGGSLGGSNCTVYDGQQISAKQGNSGTSGNSSLTFTESFPNGFPGIAGKPYTYALIEFRANANDRFQIVVELAITGSAFQSTSNSSAEPQPVAFEGPLLRGVDRRSFAAETVSSMTIVGKRLSKVTSVTINGKAAEIEAQTNTGLTLTIPALPSGRYDLVLETKGGKITVLGLLNIR